MNKVIAFTGADGMKAKSHRKENHFTGSLSLLGTRNGVIVKYADLRFYHTQATSYACLWVFNTGTPFQASGSGKAGGYGYHRESAATAEAFTSAGIRLEHDIDGRGYQSEVEAMEALGNYIGVENLYICESHP